jgi:general secretion pathway protein I
MRTGGNNVKLRRRARQAGFTLIEVLIALAIIAIAMGAVLHAMGSMASNTEDARERMLAVWSADDALSTLRVTQAWPDPGHTVFPCPQGQYRFVCRQTVTSLDSPVLREISVSVFSPAARGAVLAEVVSVVQNEKRF